MKTQPKNLFLPAVIAAMMFTRPAAADALFTTDTTIGAGNDNYDGQDIIVFGCTLTVDGQHSFSDLLIVNQGTLTHSPSTYGVGGLNLTVSNNVVVEAGSSIVADGRGYGGGQGPGPGASLYSDVPYGPPLYYTSGGGGAYGGQGGASSGGATGGAGYGLVLSATNLGSGGGLGSGPGGSGGGVINLKVGGAILADGNISANGEPGTNTSSGGGSGGGINLSAQLITGAGTISANGGAGEPFGGGGGGGGRIALYVNTNEFTGALAAQGGSGASIGGAGTIYTKSVNVGNPLFGQVIVDNGGFEGTNTVLSTPEPFNLTISDGAVVSFASGKCELGNLVMVSNAWVLVTNSLSIYPIGNATIGVGCGIIADGQGSAGGQGTGAGTSFLTNGYYVGGGGAYGGYGGENNLVPQGGDEIYGSITEPMLPGSGGGRGNGTSPYNAGGSGGGALYLSLTGTLQLSGTLSANGVTGIGEGSGGGSGGSIWISAAVLTGAGMISANGGAGQFPLGGGGGGGRAAISLKTNLFTGAVTAYGGAGSVAGGAGTIYTLVSQTSSVGLLTVNNGGQQGTNTLLLEPPQNCNLTIANGAVVVPQSENFEIDNLLIASNGVLTMVGAEQLLSFNVIGNATIQPGGAVLLDGRGYTPSIYGPGTGGVGSTNGIESGGGGGYGGYGGGGGFGGLGGNTYGSIAQPTQGGSAGASTTGNSPFNLGGFGGGAVELAVSGDLQVNGRISANGYAGVGQGSGGGAGGGIFLNAGELAGNGVISANGGAGESVLGGGGGGGRVAVILRTNLFVGSLTAYGGPGHVAGGAGTVYIQTNGSPYSQLVLDNGGLQGTNTLIGSSESSDLSIAHGAVASIGNGGTSFHNLLIGTNGLLTVSQNPQEQGVVELNANGNATIQAGGAIILDGKGAPGGTSTGIGTGGSGTVGGSIMGGGGGFGGSGGSSAGGIPGGICHYIQTDTGSSGGNGGGTAPNNVGGAGGGSIQVNVAGTLTLAGAISASGTPGVGQASGGGSGGSITLAAGGLFGNGTITANGGAGEPSLGGGGGGGGGRISLAVQSNLFSGFISAYGGAGGVYGGAGTISLRVGSNGVPASETIPRIIIDNGGHRGTNTAYGNLLGYYFPTAISDLIITNGGVVAVAAPITYETRNLIIASNSLLTVAGSGEPASVAFGMTGNATVMSGGAISADGRGYGSAGGLGAGLSSSGSSGTTGTGGGYGGNGGAGAGGLAGGVTYGSIMLPESPGSGGGAGNGAAPFNLGGAGGGAVQLTINGTLQLAGTISANGLTGVGEGSGGGSGGSVLLTVGNLSGTGIISANGGAAESALGGGGGGGRVAVVWGTNQFAGILSASGGNGFVLGAPGTIYTRASSTQTGQILVAGNGSPAGNYTTLTEFSSSDLILTNGAKVNLLPGSLIRNLVITSKSILGLYGSNAATPLVLALDNATVAAGAGIIADAAGYSGNQGPGAGSNSVSSHGVSAGTGATHGGYGGTGASGAPDGSATGSVLQPSDPGSGGGSGFTPYSQSAGGGVIHLTVQGALDVDGTISANGATPSTQGSGGGAGGSIWLTAQQLTGAGVILANGGSGNLPYGGGGGGGRVAVYATSSQNTNPFAGTISAHGGQGFVGGGAGTVYVQASTNGSGSLLIDNGGLQGTNTPLAGRLPCTLTVSGGAVLQPPPLVDPTLELNGLLVQSNGLITTLTSTDSLSVIVLGNATVATNGSISVNGDGFDGVNSNGPGAGVMLPGGSGSGGGYGGDGGASASGEPGGAAYGSSQQPVDWGSQGGLPGTGYADLSQGGGAMRLEVGGTLAVNGTITANGTAAHFPASGGGSGGSIWLSAGTLNGNGAITANGGAGEPTAGGGGGGGRIALYSLANNFGGVTQAMGGVGANSGQNGTVLLTNLPTPQIIAQSPSGTVTNAVSSVALTFNSQLASSVTAADVVVTTPMGVLSAGSVSLSVSNMYPQDDTEVLISFPPQNTIGAYTIQFNPAAEDIYGLFLPATNAISFAVAGLAISGKIAGTNGAPMAGAIVQPTGGLPATNADVNGNYVLTVPPGWTGSLTPSQPGMMFVPGSLSYASLSAVATNQNFIGVPASALAIQAASQGPNLNLSWYSVAGVVYQVQASTDLVHWVPYGNPISGTNGAITVAIPLNSGPPLFFRFGAGPAQ